MKKAAIEHIPEYVDGKSLRELSLPHGKKLRDMLEGLTLVPLSVYFKGPWAKVEVGLARARRKGDKRQALKKREAQRDIDRASRRRR